MGKRFIDTDLNRKSMRGVDVRLRFAFEWLWSNCDHAGVWQTDLDLFKFETGYKLDIQGLLKSCPRVEMLANGSLFLRDFIAVNYGALKEGYNPHKPVFRSLKANGIETLDGMIQGLPKGSPTLEEEGEDEEEGNIPGKERARGPNPQVQAVIDHLTEALKANDIAPSLDGSEKDNRFAAANLVRKLAKDYPDFDPVDSAKRLIDFATTDAFHGRNSTNVGYLFRNVGKIAADAKAQKTNPKTMTDEQYRNASKAEAERRFGGR